MVVPDDQLSLAIGKEGQNARLAAKLTGYKIDIKSASAAHEWEEEDALAEAKRAAQAEEADDEDVFAEEPQTARTPCPTTRPPPLRNLPRTPRRKRPPKKHPTTRPPQKKPPKLRRPDPKTNSVS